MGNYALLSRGLNAENIYTVYTLTWDFIAFVLKSASVGNIQLFVLPQGSKVTGVMIRHTEQFDGVPGTLTASVGSDVNPTQFTIPTQDLVATPVTETNILEQGGLFTSGSHAKVPVMLNLVLSAGGRFEQLTAGSVNVYIKYYYVKTPGA